jgi:hypothetical protein
VQFPVSDNQLHFEALTAMAISPFWGLKGLYENRNPHPVIISKELFLRRPATGGKRSVLSIHVFCTARNHFNSLIFFHKQVKNFESKLY